jgi:hypothetical protein
LRWQSKVIEKKGIRLCKEDLMCCSYSEIGTIPVLKSVARIRPVKTEDTSVCVTVNCKVCRSARALYYLLLRVARSGVSKWSINPIIQSKPRLIVTTPKS